MPKDFICIADWSARQIHRIVDRACHLRGLRHAGERPQTLQGRTLAMYFEKPSLRTHVTFEAGMSQLGGQAVLLRSDHVGIGTRENEADVARNLSRWVDCIMARTFSHELIESLAEHASVPVINGLTDLLHPCQAAADLMTIGRLQKPEEAILAYVGDGNNVAHSLLLMAALVGMDIRVGTPESHAPNAGILERARKLAEASGSTILWTGDPHEAVAGAHFIYTDTWTSMGQEAEAEERRQTFSPFQVNEALVAGAPNAWLMHCLPAHRGEEITAELLDGERSLIYEQAENRLHAQKAILERLILPAFDE